MKFGFLFTVVALTLCGVGCSNDYDPNYKTEVKMSEADKAKEKEMMAGQNAPGMAPERGEKK